MALINDNFDLAAPKPIDSRMVKSTISERDAITQRFTGLEVLVTADFTKYLWNGSTWVISSSGASGIAGGDLSGTYPNPTVLWANGYSTYDTRYIRSALTYDNPTWLNTLSWSKITSRPTTIEGYGITNGWRGEVPTQFNIPTVSSTAYSFTSSSIFSNTTQAYISPSYIPFETGVAFGIYTSGMFKLPLLTTGVRSGIGNIEGTVYYSVENKGIYFNNGAVDKKLLIDTDLYQIAYDYQIIGVRDGVNTLFTLPEEAKMDSLKVWVNGLRLHPGIGYDYIHTTFSTFTLTFPLEADSVILVEYLKK